MRGVTFNLKDNLDVNKIGLIAQEVEKIVPEVVIEGNTDEKIKSVAYSSLVGLLVEAINPKQISI